MSAAYQTGTASTTDALYQIVRAVMVANGWTLIDTISDVSGNRDLVFRGAPLDADAQNYIYVRLTWVAAAWSHRVYLDWDTGTHVGSREAGVAGQTAITANDSQYWIRVNEFAVAVCVKIGSSYYKAYFGYMRRGLPAARAGLTRTTAGYAAGTVTMAVASDMTSRLALGQKVIIYNHGHSSAGANFLNKEMVIIQGITPTTITFTAGTAYAYDAGAVIGWNPNPAIVCYWDSGESIGSASYTSLYHDSYYSSNTGQALSLLPVVLTTETYADPDEVSLEWMGGVYTAHSTSAGRTGFFGYLFHWEVSAGGNQIKEIELSDGVYSFVALGISTNYTILLGPT